MKLHEKFSIDVHKSDDPRGKLSVLRNIPMEETSSSTTMGLGAAILAHRFISKSRKSVRRDLNRNLLVAPEDGGTGSLQTGVNARQAILDMQKRVEQADNVKSGQKSKNWDMIKKKITTAKITEALTALKFEVNGKKVTVLRPLGEGGYSQVYEVYDKDKKIFALKIVDLSVQSDKMKNDLIREIVFLEKLKNCKFVVRAFDYEIRETEDEHKMFVVMEKGDKDLFQILARHKENKTLSPARLRFYWEQMLEAVNEVHNNNIIHADIKPGNFLLVPGELKIIDFGMAMELSSGQDYVVRKFLGGTKEFMSPEVYAGYVIEDGAINREAMSVSQGVKFSIKSDIWALGIILYQAVYGNLPFASVPGGKLAKYKALGSPDLPVEFEDVNNLDPALLDTMKRCLEKSPDNRATVDELLKHAYMQPEHAAAAGPQVCANCRSHKKAMARISQKRSYLNGNSLLC